MSGEFRGTADGRVFHDDGTTERELSPKNPFHWWEKGAEGTDLALAILKATTRSFATSKWGPRFADEIIDNLPREGFTLPADVVRLWLREVRK